MLRNEPVQINWCSYPPRLDYWQAYISKSWFSQYYFWARLRLHAFELIAYVSYDKILSFIITITMFSDISNSITCNTYWMYGKSFFVRPGEVSSMDLHWEIFLPGSGGSEWIRSTDPVDCISLSLGQIWSMPINLGCSDHSVCFAPSDHLNLFRLYLINLVVIDWPGWSGHFYQSVHIPISLPLLLCFFPCLDSGKVVILLRSRLLVTHYLVVLFVENPQLHRNKYSNTHTNIFTPTQTHSRTWKTPTLSQ